MTLYRKWRNFLDPILDAWDALFYDPAYDTEHPAYWERENAEERFKADDAMRSRMKGN